ncbi:MAG: hypothetical protein HYY16_07920 [Planctomycetes bacterium]|nr:hypothetical protein [Planctomycetota bacterium]
MTPDPGLVINGAREGGAPIGGFLNWTFPLFRLFGIPIRCHWFYPVLVAMYVLQALAEGGARHMGWMAMVMAALLVTTIVHELGHCFMAQSLGQHADQILLWPLGGLAYVGRTHDPRQDIKISAAGPLAQVPIALLCIAILLAVGKPWSWGYLNPFEAWWPYGFTFWEGLCLAVLKLQVVLILFNLLVPAYPLDGGSILVNFLLMRYSRSHSALVTTYFSIPIGIAITIWGFVQRELLLGFLGIWVLLEAWQIRRLLQWGEIEAHPMFAAAPEFDYAPPRARRPGFFARWRMRRAERRARQEAQRTADLRQRVDAILEKVSREGIDSLTGVERKILEEASREASRNRDSQ